MLSCSIMRGCIKGTDSTIKPAVCIGEIIALHVMLQWQESIRCLGPLPWLMLKVSGSSASPWNSLTSEWWRVIGKISF